MDVTQGDFRFDVRSGKVTSSVAKNGYLDPVIANEGTRVILSDGSEISFNPPPVKPVIPDWSEYKSIRHYFTRTDYHFFPTWLYHPTEEPVIAQNAQEAFEKYGVHLLERTDDEQAQFGGGKYRWLFDRQWRTTPYDKKAKFDALNPGANKNYVPTAPNPQIAQHALIEQVVAAMSSGQNEFLKNLLTAMGIVPANHTSQQEVSAAPALNASPVDDERVVWEAQAKELGLKVDGRWSLDRLKKEVTAAFDKRADAERAFIQSPETATDP
jgi:hypothetical protein